MEGATDGHATGGAGGAPALARQDEVWVGERLVVSGHPVGVSGIRGRFVFKEVVVNLRTGQRWANVFGGPTGRERARSVTVDRLRPAPHPERPAEQLVLDLGPRLPG